MNRVVGIGTTCVALMLAATAAVPQTTNRQECVDLVVVGKVTQQEATPFPGGLTMSWPWTLTLDVERVVYGTETARQITLMTVMHAHLIDDQPFMLLLRRTATGYVTAEGSQRIIPAVKDRGGRLVMPVPEPLTHEYLFPQSWIPTDYEQYLLAIDYDYRDFDLDAPPYWENEYNAGSEWLSKLDGHIYAKRGLLLDTVPNFLARNGLGCR